MTMITKQSVLVIFKYYLQICFFIFWLKSHHRSSSYNSVCAFIQPESNLETSLVRQSSQAHANPISMARREAGASGTRGTHSSSSAELHQSSTASTSSVNGYVDTVVDQYVVIEASPSGSVASTQSSMHEVRGQVMR